jgi:hypothetical protein
MDTIYLVLFTSLATTLVMLFLFLTSALVLKLQMKQQSYKQSLMEALLYLWDHFWAFVFFPITLFKGLFFSLNGEKNEDGSTKRANFSMTRTLFALAGFIMLSRLFLGGLIIEELKLGPQVEEKRATYVYKPITLAEKQKAKEEKQKAKEEKRENALQEKEKALEKKEAKYFGAKKKELKEAATTRPFFYVKKFRSDPVEFYEIVLFLIIAGVYFFRKDFNKGGYGLLKFIRDLSLLQTQRMNPSSPIVLEESKIDIQISPPPPAGNEK